MVSKGREKLMTQENDLSLMSRLKAPAKLRKSSSRADSNNRRIFPGCAFFSIFAAIGARFKSLSVCRAGSLQI